MKQWAEENAEKIATQHTNKGIEAIIEAITILNGAAMFMSTSYFADAFSVAFNELQRSNFTDKYKGELQRLYRSYYEATDYIKAATAHLTDDDMKFFNANPGYFIAPDGKRMSDLTGDVTSQFEFIERGRRVGYNFIFCAGQIMSTAVARYVEATKNYAVSDFYADTTKLKETFVWRTACGSIIISGFGNDTYETDADFIIDLGGDDVYKNNAGGCDSTNDRLALCIDHSGNDRYVAKDRNYVQGFGFLGIGFLVDMAGKDCYYAKHFSQGSGIMGVGAIWDLQGDDIYQAEAFVQGAAMFGLGVILDNSGSDFYECATLGQGAATTLGLGILSDLEGDDCYYLGWTDDKDALGQLPGYGQGGALSFRHYPWRKKMTAYGGVGMLVDNNGDDKYRSKGWCVQGGSYIMSLGVLFDANGDDEYISSCGQGSGIHVTNAILIDKNGNDLYEGQFRNGGSGGDRSPGFLIDYQGNDFYKSKTSSYGTGVKPFSYSLFIDYQGDDTYMCSEPADKITFNNWDSFGGVWPESEPYLWPYAICLDLNGNDNYEVRKHKNNSERHSFGHGIHIDTEWKGGDVIGKIDNPLLSYEEFKLPKISRKCRYYHEFRHLTEPGNFTRFQAIGRIANGEPDIVPLLVDLIVNSTHRQINRDAMECLHYFFVKGKIKDKEIKSLNKLLYAKDEEIRLIIADDFGIWRITKAENELIKVLERDRNGQVRRFALRSLLELKSVKALRLVRNLAINDASDDVRRIAVRFLSRVKDNSDPYPILIQVLQNDPNSSVKVAAVEAIGYLQRPEAIELLQKVANSADVYLQRAAGAALAQLGQIDGIEILINSLSFPSIDAFYNYDRNIPNVIAGYTNFDFNEQERYDQKNWHNWFEENRTKIDITANAITYGEFQTLSENFRDSTNIAQIEKYEKFLERYPSFKRMVKLLAGKLNEVAWQMVTVPKGTKAYDPQNGLRYARRAVVLNPDPNYYDTLIEAYLANGLVDEAAKVCRIMLDKYPGEKIFVERLQEIPGIRNAK